MYVHTHNHIYIIYINVAYVYTSSLYYTEFKVLFQLAIIVMCLFPQNLSKK